MNTINLDLDQLIKSPNLHPYQISKLDKIIVHINHNPVITNKYNLYPAIFSSMELTNFYPKVIRANSSFASFHLRKGMEFSLLTTLRGNHFFPFYYKFIFFLLPSMINSMENSSMIFKKVNSNGCFNTGIKLNPNTTANILFVLNNNHPKWFHLNCFFNSYFLLPIKY